MTVRSISAVLLAGLFAVASAACDVHVGDKGVSVDVASGRANQDWTRTYTLANSGALSIENTNGSIEVEPSTGTQVEVKATIQARAGSEEEAQDLLKKIEIKEDAVSPGEVRIKTTVGVGQQFGRRSAAVEYHVKVPAGLVLTLKTQNGGVALRGISGTVTAATTNGDVRALNLSGAISARTVNGGITVDLARATGPIDAQVVNGGIGLRLPADINAQLDAHVVNGGVTIQDGLGLSGEERTRTSVKGTLHAGGLPISASTVNGGVRVNLRDESRPGSLNSTN